MRYPTIEQFESICRMFLAASDIFDRLNVHGRHNMPNYNLCWHQITHHLGIRHHVESRFYWPLLKTPKVLASLLVMWRRIAEPLNWRVAGLEELTSMHRRR